ncbi:MAG: hypothetical protein ACLSG5_02530 [Oscillospiraceae bacterium]
MERGINRWLNYRSTCRSFRGSGVPHSRESLGSPKEGDEYFPLCEYISVDLLKTDVTVIPYGATVSNEVPQRCSAHRGAWRQFADDIRERGIRGLALCE